MNILDFIKMEIQFLEDMVLKVEREVIMGAENICKICVSQRDLGLEYIPAPPFPTQ